MERRLMGISAFKCNKIKSKECKTRIVEYLNNVHLAQTLTYLKLGHYKLGLLINFNVLFLKHGIKRVVNDL